MTFLLPALLLALAGIDEPYTPAAQDAEGPASQPGVAARTPQVPQDAIEVRLERLSAAIPWPRGIALVDGDFVVLARGRHRNYGGPDPAYEDHGGRLYVVDADVSEPYSAGRPAGPTVRANARVLAEPDAAVVDLFDRNKPALENFLMSRPYCTLLFDEPSQNLIFCAYSGVDTSERPSFRKNATDALYRYDLRTGRWAVVERHDPDVVPEGALGPWISNEYYPHHDPAENAPPHGLLNGPNGCTVAGHWLYAVGKDNHALARYDLRAIREDASAGAPPAEVVLGEEVQVRLEGSVRTIPVKGHSALAAHEGWLYVGFRTSNVVLRFPLEEDGTLVEPIVGELIAEFEPYDPEAGRGADIWDLAVDPEGRLYVSCSREGRIWRLKPDPDHPFDGNDRRPDAATPNTPYVDLRAATGNARASASNLAFDAEGRLVFCATLPEPDLPHAGAVFRVLEGS